MMKCSRRLPWKNISYLILPFFFACVDVEKCPPRKFLDDWLHSLWNLNLGLKISFCRQIQRGLYIIFFANPESQGEVLKRHYWTVRKTSFRALAWSLEAVNEEILALSCPRWVIIKDVSPFLWKFLPQLLEDFGKIIHIDETSHLVPNIDARILLSIKPGVDIPSNLNLNIGGDFFVCPVEILGGLNACFLCKRDEHLRKYFPILINRRKPNMFGLTGTSNGVDTSTPNLQNLKPTESNVPPKSSTKVISTNNDSKMQNAPPSASGSIKGKELHCVDNTTNISGNFMALSIPPALNDFQVVTNRKRR